MPSNCTPVEEDVRFQGYRLEVVSRWPASQRKTAAAAAISQRLASIARTALVRPDVEDLIQLSCRLLDDLFASGQPGPADPSASSDNASARLPAVYALVD